MKLSKILGVALIAVGLSAPAFAQQAAPAGQPDQVDQLAQMVGLSDDQQKDIRAILDDMQDKIRKKQEKAQQLRQELQAQIKPDYDADVIQEKSEKLGVLTGQMAALSTLMQAKVDKVFTQEQRDKLEQRMREMRQQMQQMQQQRQMQQAPAPESKDKKDK